MFTAFFLDAHSLQITMSIVSDVGFRQTLKIRTLGCARSLSLLPIYALARYDLADELDELATQKDTRFILVRATVVV